MEQEIDLRELLFVLRRRLLVILLLPVVAMLTSAAVSFYVLKPVYQASATLMVGRPEAAIAGGGNPVEYTELMTNKVLVKTYSEIAKSRTVAEDVVKASGVQLGVESLRSMIQVSLVGDTELIQIKVDDEDPVRARQLTEVASSVFMQRVIEIMKVDNVKVVDPPVVPTAPVRPNKKLNIAVAMVLGLMVAIGLAFLLEYLDDTVKTKDDVTRQTGVPVLGAIPMIEEVSAHGSSYG